jgi:hypothetical protein
MDRPTHQPPLVLGHAARRPIVGGAATAPLTAAHTKSCHPSLSPTHSDMYKIPTVPFVPLFEPPKFPPTAMSSATHRSHHRFAVLGNSFAPFFFTEDLLHVTRPPDSFFLGSCDRRSTTPHRHLPCLPPHRRQPRPCCLHPYFFDIELRRDFEKLPG